MILMGFLLSRSPHSNGGHYPQTSEQRYEAESYEKSQWGVMGVVCPTGV